MAQHTATPNLNLLSLRLYSSQLEYEFWRESQLLRQYLGTVDKWAWISVTVCNLLLLIMGGFLQHSGLVIGVATSLAAVYLQRIFLSASPRWYWRYRPVLVGFNVYLRQLMLCAFPISTAAAVARLGQHIPYRSDSAVLLCVLMLAGKVTSLALVVNFQTGFHSTIVSSFTSALSSLVVHGGDELRLLSHPSAQPALTSICTAVHSAYGHLFLLPPAVAAGLTAVCIERPAWLAVFLHLLTFMTDIDRLHEGTVIGAVFSS